VLLLQQLEWTTDPYGNRVVSDTSEVGPEVTWLFVLGGALYLAFFVWNAVVRQGRTGTPSARRSWASAWSGAAPGNRSGRS
jgi:hypothetical protein